MVIPLGRHFGGVMHKSRFVKNTNLTPCITPPKWRPKGITHRDDKTMFCWLKQWTAILAVQYLLTAPLFLQI
jgi:hypothetical protein